MAGRPILRKRLQTLVWLLHSPSERSETGRDYVFTLVCLCALSPIGLNGWNAEKCIWLVHEKLRIFLYGQYTIGNVLSLAFWRYSHVQDWSRGWGEMYKNVRPFLMDFPHTPQHAVHGAMTSLSLARVYCARTLLGRRVCKRVDVYMITLSRTWRIYALSERLLVVIHVNLYSKLC